MESKSCQESGTGLLPDLFGTLAYSSVGEPVKERGVVAHHVQDHVLQTECAPDSKNNGFTLMVKDDYELGTQVSTLITAPTIDPAFYQYYIGQALPLDISLSGVYISFYSL